jgi:solute carrier family 10 (sodium/bile acid cotransporter), member 7
MAVIFFIFGLTLDSSELMSALRAWRAIVLGLVSMLVLTPLSGFVSLLLPFRPYEFSLGLAVMACVPTSLSSGVTLVIGGYGNGALALLFTVSGNILGIVTAPLAVKLVLGSQTDAHVNSGDLLVKLGVSILMPLLVGKALRESVPPLQRAVPAYKVPLYLINNLQITLIVWQKLSSAREVLVEQEFGNVLLAGAWLRAHTHTYIYTHTDVHARACACTVHQTLHGRAVTCPQLLRQSCCTFCFFSSTCC